MKKFAVIGKDVSKSLSPEIHKFIAENTGSLIEYEKVSVPETGFANNIKKLFSEYDGLNVTIPFKISVINHLNKIEGDAKIFGAVNTVRTGDKSGYNTDGLGFMLMLKNNGIDVRGKTVLVLGAGGAGRSVAKKLSDVGADVSVYDKNFEKAKTLKNEFCKIRAVESIDLKSYYAIINASGVGMHATEGVSPVNEDLLSLCSVAIDLIYEPEKSEFLKIAEKCGKKAVNGKAMLFYQAYYAQRIFLNKSADEREAKKLFAKYTEGSK